MIRPRSKKQIAIDAKLKKLFIETIIPNFGGRCTGCGWSKNLTPSHIIRRSKRLDLVLEQRNIKPHCLSCHINWDSGIISEMKKCNDFEDNMAYIKEVDPHYYNRLISKEND